MPQPQDQIVELDVGVIPEAAISGAVLYQTEESTTLTFNGMRRRPQLSWYGGPHDKIECTATVVFDRCLVTKFGHPNDEARGGIDRYPEDLAYGIFEIRNSSWIKQVIELNRQQFPNTPDDYISRHFLFLFHDSTFECLADGLTVTTTNDPYSEIAKSIFDRITLE